MGKLIYGLFSFGIGLLLVWVLMVAVLALGICLKTIFVAAVIVVSIWVIGCLTEAIFDEIDKERQRQARR